MTDRTVQKLAAYSTIKGMADSNQYKNQYFILAEFIKYIISEKKLYTFSIDEMIDYLRQEFEFDIPYAVVKSSINKIIGLRRKGDSYTAQERSLISKEFNDLQKKATSDGGYVLEKLKAYVFDCLKEEVLVEQLESDFIKFVLDRNDVQDLKYGEIISKFIIAVEGDNELQMKIEKIREGSVLYCGLCYNLIEIGSVTDDITLYLDTEVLFYLVGYNGQLSQKIALDFLSLVNKANAKKKKISLSYFVEVKDEIDRYFSAAYNIVAGKNATITSRAMSAIVNDCESESDVLDRQSDFYYELKKHGIFIDKYSDVYYKNHNYKFNIETDEYADDVDSKWTESLKYVSHINVLRKGSTFNDYMKSQYLIVSETRNLHAISNKMRPEGKCGFSVTISKITNILWMKLGGAFGKECFPFNVNIAVKARVALDGSIATKANKVFSQTSIQYKEGQITEEQAALRILRIQEKIVDTEDITENTIDDLLDFSPESIQRYEHAFKLNKEVISKKELIIAELKEQNNANNKEKANLVTKGIEKDKLIQEQKELILQYQRNEVLKYEKLIKIRKVVVIIGIFLTLALIFILCGFVPDEWTFTKICRGVSGLIGLYGTICTIWPDCNIFSRISSREQIYKDKHVTTNTIFKLLLLDFLLLIVNVVIFRYAFS